MVEPNVVERLDPDGLPAATVLRYRLGVDHSHEILPGAVVTGDNENLVGGADERYEPGASPQDDPAMGAAGSREVAKGAYRGGWRGRGPRRAGDDAAQRA